jgi:glycosyltransferase involved in cell wall biosynthesis
VAVVASRIDGIPEDVVHNDSALLVRLGDVCQLCESLAKVIINSALRRRLQQRSRETFLEKFSPELFTSALHETYRGGKWRRSEC